MDRLALETELKTEILNVVLNSDGDLKKMNLDKIVQIAINLNEIIKNNYSSINNMSEKYVLDFETEQEEIRNRMNSLRN